MNDDHLLDHDNSSINKAEAIIDEIIDLAGMTSKQKELREQWINIACAKMIVDLLQRLPAEEKKSDVAEFNKGVSVEFANKFKAKFTDEELLGSFHSSIKYVLKDKMSAFKKFIQDEKKLSRIDELINKIGR